MCDGIFFFQWTTVAIFLYRSILLLGQISLVADLHLPQRLADWVSAASPLASNWIPQLFLFNSQTSEESQCKPQQRQKERK